MRLTTSRVIASALALPVLAGVGIVVAPSAMAAATPSVIQVTDTGGNPANATCNTPSNTNVFIYGTSTPVTNITADAGDSITLRNTCNYGGGFDLQFIPNVGSTVTVDRMGGGTGTMTLSAGTTSIQIKSTTYNTVLATLTVTLSSAPSGGGTAASGPAPWLQSFARASAAATCPTGYGASWAQWPNGGKGGFVCNRTLVFDGSAYNWITG